MVGYHFITEVGKAAINGEPGEYKPVSVSGADVINTQGNYQHQSGYRVQGITSGLSLNSREYSSHLYRDGQGGGQSLV